MSQSFTVKEVAEHKTAESGIYIIVDDGVYNVTGESTACHATPWFTLFRGEIALPLGEKLLTPCVFRW